MSLILQFSRLAVNSTRGLHTSPALKFWQTPVLFAEPLKKKKRIDPAVLKAREERRKRKIEKQIRRLEKNEQQLKPIDECEVPLTLIDERKQRTRKLRVVTAEVKEERAALIREWSIYRNAQKQEDVHTIDMLAQAQKRALQELRLESEELYQEAIQIDISFVPYSSVGPVETPPIKNYEAPDGDYVDVSKKWE